MKLQIVGCSHHSASVAVRERLALDAAQTRAALARWRERFPDIEAVVLSTCNRVELFTAAEDEQHSPSHQDVVDFLAGFHELSTAEVLDELFERTGEDAVVHLFAVAAGLDSMVVGEPQILSQVKQAYDVANNQQSTGPLTHELFQAALRAAKRVSTETTVGSRRVSIPSIAISVFAKQIFERLDDKRILVLGAGEMGEETLRYVQGEGARDITILNRTGERAHDLALRTGGRVEPWETLHAALAQADLVVSTTGAAEPIVSVANFRRHIQPRRAERPMFVLDLAIPRDFDPAIGAEADVFLYSIDDLQGACDQNRRERARELPVAMAIVHEEAARFMADLHHRATAPIIRRLREGWEGLKEDELQRLLKRMPGLDDRDRQEIAHSFDRLVNKLLHPPLESLREESRHGPPHGLMTALKRLFHIED